MNDTVYRDFNVRVAEITISDWIEKFQPGDAFVYVRDISGLIALRHFKSGNLFVLKGPIVNESEIGGMDLNTSF